MRYLFICIGFIAISAFRSSPLTESDQSVSLYIFLHDQCVISQYYTLPLKEYHERYKERIRFYGVFPNQDITKDRLNTFNKKYQMPFPLQVDSEGLVEKFNAMITPEVVLYDEENEVVLYQGRIDNAYARLGRKRRIITKFELADALLSISKGESIKVKKTKAMGCFIQKKKME